MGMSCAKTLGALTGDPGPSPSESPTAQMRQPRDIGATKCFALNAHHIHGHHSHRRGTNGIDVYALYVGRPVTAMKRSLLIVSAEVDQHVHGKCNTFATRLREMDMASLKGCGWLGLVD